MQQKISSILDDDIAIIENDSQINYGYYNSLSLNKEWHKNVFPNILLEKIFVEWCSIVDKKLNLKNTKLIIDQFNIIDNTFNDDEYHSSLIKYDTQFHKELNIENFNRSMRIISSIAYEFLDGVGVWALCDTVNGQVYNGTFKFGLKGWETDGQLHENTIKLQESQFLSSNLAYIRISNHAKHNVLIHAFAKTESELSVSLGNIRNKVKILSDNKIKLQFENPNNKILKIECLSGAVDISRIDCYNLELKSLMFDSNKKPKETYAGMKHLFDSMVP